MNETMDEHPRRLMRRKDREITDRSEIDALIRSQKLMHLALVDGDRPFLVPVFYAFDGAALYFHSASAGTKIEILKRNQNVCFEIGDWQGIIESGVACDFEAKHRTVIGFGRAFLVDDEAEKITALDRLVANFTAKKFEYPKANLNCTRVIRIEIVSVKGKQHGF